MKLKALNLFNAQVGSGASEQVSMGPVKIDKTVGGLAVGTFLAYASARTIWSDVVVPIMNKIRDRREQRADAATNAGQRNVAVNGKSAINNARTTGRGAVAGVPSQRRAGNVA